MRRKRADGNKCDLPVPIKLCMYKVSAWIWRYVQGSNRTIGLILTRSMAATVSA